MSTNDVMPKLDEVIATIHKIHESLESPEFLVMVVAAAVKNVYSDIQKQINTLTAKYQQLRADLIDKPATVIFEHDAPPIRPKPIDARRADVPPPPPSSPPTDSPHILGTMRDDMLKELVRLKQVMRDGQA